MQKKSLETVLYSTAGVAAMALILIAANVLAGAMRQRVDLTKEKAYTLSDGTRAILAKLDTPVKVRFYCSQAADTSPETVFLKGYARKVEDLLVEYKQAAKGKILLEKYDPKPDSDAEDSARLDGIEGVPLANGEQFYLGLAVSLLDSKETIPFLAPNEERLLEYKISRCISRVEKPDKPVVGIMSALPVYGMPSNPMMMQMGQRGSEPWALVTELQNDFAVKRVDMTTDKIDDEIKVLVVIHPKDITEAAQYAIDQFVMRGGKLIAFLDASSLVDSRQQNPMMQMPGGGSSLDKLLKAWGLQFENAKVVADMNYKMQVGGGGGAPSERPTWLAITPEGIHSNDVVTSQIDNIWYFSGGVFTGTPAAGLKETVLLKSTTDSQLVDGFMANLSGESVLKDFKPDGKEYALAIRLTGKFKTAFPDGKPAEKKDDEKKDKDVEVKENKQAEKKPDNSLKESKDDTTVILVGDADMVNDNFSLRKMQTPFGNLATPLNGNLSFAQNAVEQLSGDNNLIAVRSRATINRPFTVVKRLQAEAEMKFRGKLKELEDGRAEAERRLSELQQNKEKGQRFILSPEQQAEVEKFNKKKVEASRALKQVQKDLRREVDQLENRVKWWNIFAMPLAVTACGVLLAVYKRKLTGAK